MRFEWSQAKNRENLRKHRIEFDTARLVFDDPWLVSLLDSLHDDYEERFIAIGAVGPGLILTVIHTWQICTDDEVIRIISARAASARERRIYEEAHQESKERYRRHRRDDGC